MTTPSEPMVLRISPSGQIAGDETNPPLIGGTATPPDGSIQVGRTWLYNGTVGITPSPQVPGTTSAGSVVGMESLPVDLRSGYKYDLIADVDVFGTLVAEGSYLIIVDGSVNGGATWTYPSILLATRYVGDTDGEGSPGQTEYMVGHTRGIGQAFPAGVTINRVRLMLQRLNTNQDTEMVYNPDTCILQINEYN